jgi:hypothetical protein
MPVNSAPLGGTSMFKMHPGKLQTSLLLCAMLLPFSMGCPDLHGRPKQDERPSPPSAPVIVGPTNVIKGNSYIYILSATDPQGYMVTFQTTTPDCTIINNTLTFVPSTVGIIKISVTSENSLNLKSEKTEYSVTVSLGPAA